MAVYIQNNQVGFGMNVIGDDIEAHPSFYFDFSSAQVTVSDPIGDKPVLVRLVFDQGDQSGEMVAVVLLPKTAILM